MELTKSKFKQTEVGLIPEDWDLNTIESLTPKYGKYHIVDGPFGSNLKTEHYRKKGIPIITSGFVTNGYFKADVYLYVDIEKFHQEKRSAVKGGDIVMAKIGARCGASAILPLDHQEGILSGNALKITIEENKYSTKLIWQILFNKYKKGDLENITTTGAQPAVSMQNLKKLIIPLPPTLAEQKAIATALSDVDELIAKLEKLIEKKKAIKQGAMQALLTPPHKGGKRLEGFSGEWVEKRLGDIGKTYSGLTGKTKIDFENGERPYITFLNVLTNVKIKCDFAYVKISPNETQNIAKLGDLFFNTSSETPEEVGKCAVLLDDVPNLYLNSFCFGYRLTEDSQCNGLFLSYLINSNIGRNLFQSLAQGATRYNLSKSNFNNVILTVPKLEEQNIIANILSDLDSEIEEIQLKKSKLIQLKQGMMQELLTGRTRLI